jgi:transcriptional regulator with XRE-family HTH domain
VNVGTTTTTDSSKRLIEFLESNRLHKKDFAEMIGVTLSYVYSLIDSKVAFSKRITTLERIAVVMGMSPDEFPEYKSPEEPKLIDPGVQYLKIQQKKLGLSNVQLLKRFPRNRRVDIVDLWRGALPLPLDWNYLSSILQVLQVSPKDFYPYWQTRMQQYLISGGIDPVSNAGFLNSIFNSSREYLKI